MVQHVIIFCTRQYTTPKYGDMSDYLQWAGSQPTAYVSTTMGNQYNRHYAQLVTPDRRDETGGAKMAHHCSYRTGYAHEHEIVEQVITGDDRMNYTKSDKSLHALIRIASRLVSGRMDSPGKHSFCTLYICIVVRSIEAYAKRWSVGRAHLSRYCWLPAHWLTILNV